jgi:capsid protein
VNVITGDSSQHNYASGRLDHQTYFKSLRIEQSHLGRVVMDRIFSAWIAEAALLQTFAVLRSIAAPPRQFFWDGMEHVDPAKEATAQATRLASHTTTLAYEYARQGKDWEAELRQRAKERQLMKELGLVTDQPTTKEEDEDDQERCAA